MRQAPLPVPDYRPCRETQKRPLKPYDRRSPVIEVEVTVRRLVTPAVRDVVTNALIEAGPPIDDEAGWNAYRGYKDGLIRRRIHRLRCQVMIVTMTNRSCLPKAGSLSNQHQM